jgi:hypothetical protein
MSNDHWIAGAVQHKGSFTAEAKKRGMTCAMFQKMVLAHPERYPKRIVAQARLRQKLVRAGQQKN